MPDISLPPLTRTTPSSTTTSNTVIVPSAPPVVQSAQNTDMDAIRLAFTWIVAAIVGVKFLLEAIQKVLDFFERKKGIDKEKLGPLVKRVDDLENKAGKFRTVEQLDKDNTDIRDDITHMKNNIMMQVNGLADRMRGAESNYHDVNLRVERLSGKIDNCLEQNQHLVKAVERIDTKMDDNFKNITELLMARHSAK